MRFVCRLCRHSAVCSYAFHVFLLSPRPARLQLPHSTHAVSFLLPCVYPCSIPERYSLVIRSLLTQEGICMTLKPQFHFLEVAYPYVARFVEESARVCVCWWRWRGEGG